MIRVLLVDDSELFREMVDMALTLDGRMEVVGQAGDGVTAVAAVAQLRPDLVLLDLAMPGMDGLEALGHIHAVSPRTKVIILSALQGYTIRPTAFERSAQAVLQKGVPPHQIADEVVKVHSQ